ncbi:MAG: hypothetical protein SFU27_08435 [Thermonemataceae bacterium]|nr:hypothetical protein [Thermonemataceae bacterium]
MRILATIGKIITRSSIFFIFFYCTDSKERKWLDSYVYNPYYIETIYKDYIGEDKESPRSRKLEIMKSGKVKAELIEDTSQKLREIYFYFPYKGELFSKEGGAISRYVKNNHYWKEKSIIFSKVKYTKYEYNDYDKKGRLIRTRTSTHRNLEDDGYLIEHDVTIEYNEEDLPTKIRLLNHPLRLPDSINLRYSKSKELEKEIEYYSPNQDNIDSTYINYNYKYVKIDSIISVKITYKDFIYFRKN